MLFFNGVCRCELLINELADVEIYSDQELRDLWGSISDLEHPNEADYEKIHAYLLHGDRSYLNIPIEWAYQNNLFRVKYDEDGKPFPPFNFRLLQNLKVYNGSEPVLKVIQLSSTEPSSKQCITLYGSCNSGYSEVVEDHVVITGKESFSTKAERIIAELEHVGFKGYVVLRIGGYPLLEHGGLKFVHIPYSFKVLSFLEAELLGFENCLWIDLSIHPTDDLKMIFDEISSKGYYSLKNGINLEYDDNFGILPPETLSSWGIQSEDLAAIPHVIATILGVSFKHPSGRKFIKDWYQLTAELFPSMSLYPEEFLISLAFWKLGFSPSSHVGYQLNVKSLTPYRPLRSDKPFWMDKC